MTNIAPRPGQLTRPSRSLRPLTPVWLSSDRAKPPLSTVPPTTAQIRGMRHGARLTCAGLLLWFGAGCTAERPTLLEGAPVDVSVQATSQPLPTEATSSSAGSTPGESSNSNPSSTPVTSSEQSDSEEISGSAEVVHHEPIIEVVAPGSKPMTRLTLQPLGDETVDLVLIDERQIELTQDNVPTPKVFFASESPLRATNADAGGSTRLTIGNPVFHGSSGPAAMLELAKSTSSSIAGLWFDQPTTPRLGDADTKTAAVNDLHVAETFDGFIESFRLTQIEVPNQDLGVGAVWTTQLDTRLGGLSALVQTRATIIEINKTDIVAEVLIEVVFESGDIELPSGSATIIDGYSSLTGRLLWTQSSPVVLFDLEGTSDLRMQISDASGSMIIHQSLIRAYSLRLG